MRASHVVSLAAALAATLARPDPLRAQGGASPGAVPGAVPGAPSSARSVLLGTVLADSTEAPLGGAEVVVAALRRSARAGDDGTFVLRGLPAGMHVITVRGVGFEPLTARVRVTGADTVAADFVLGRRAVTLARVEVREAAPVRTVERERARSSGGAFIDEATLRASEHRPMSDVLRRVAGLTVPRIFTPRGTINAIASSRGGQAMSLLAGGEKYCFYQIYVDGVRVYSPDRGEPPEIDTFQVRDYEAIEIYRGPAQTPPTYGGTNAQCGTVLFWSRSR